MPSARPRRLLLAALALLASAATAHEFWLRPARFVVQPGARVHVGRWVGQDFAGARWPGQSSRVEELVHLKPGNLRTDLTGAATQADSLQTTVALDLPGTHVLALRTNEALISMKAEEFTAYLKEEGLEDILYLRTRRKLTDKPAKEAYRRCAKTLLLAGSSPRADTTWRTRVGHPLEIVAEQNPYALRVGASLTIRVWRNHLPADRQLVQAWVRPLDGSPVQHLQLHTNLNGRAMLRLSQPATVLLAAVHMAPHPVPATADWQSIWASLTFAFPG
ncbi:DUF4198 domain-containing protein [Hymenobacter busanensis]|uniref:DUF4198 domain-containing protein n=1 Tax=Hymenobacter busanensis TaxID=2607656 RepID=UPI0013678241|nr:DUF4198 domain-containing protein [Hymenobacter busanensis]QHJ09481.1 DUF4198 domain-containing protein [Hymenobacter busanensis]